MQYSDPTNKDGLLQDCEQWTGLGDGAITDDAVLKAQFTNRLNRRMDMASSILGQGSRLSQFDDTNYENQPFSFFNISQNVNDYQFLVDEDGNSISDITGVLFKKANSNEYVTLDRLTLDERGSKEIMSPNPTNTGEPTGYIERNNTIFLNRIPNFNRALGGKLFYKRVPSYFTVSDTTKVPGFPAEHHQYLSVGASYDWSLVNKGDNTALITRLEARLAVLESALRNFSQMRNPTRSGLRTRTERTD